MQRFMIVLLVFCFALFGDASGPRADDPYSAYKSGDHAAALKGFRALAEQGDPNAMSNLGLMYANGLGVDVDFTAARGWFEKAASQGHIGAINNLGGMYEMGQGVPQSYQEAANKYALAAKYGLSDAQYNLAALYESGKGVPSDPLQAYVWYSLAAAQGDGDAAAARDRVGAKLDPTLRSQGAALVKSWKPAQ
jgi:TPR repeat protein